MIVTSTPIGSITAAGTLLPRTKHIEMKLLNASEAGNLSLVASIIQGLSNNLVQHLNPLVLGKVLENIAKAPDLGLASASEAAEVAGIFMVEAGQYIPAKYVLDAVSIFSLSSNFDGVENIIELLTPQHIADIAADPALVAQVENIFTELTGLIDLLSFTNFEETSYEALEAMIVQLGDVLSPQSVASAIGLMAQAFYFSGGSNIDGFDLVLGSLSDSQILAISQDSVAMAQITSAFQSFITISIGITPANLPEAIDALMEPFATYIDQQVIDNAIVTLGIWQKFDSVSSILENLDQSQIDNLGANVHQIFDAFGVELGTNSHDIMFADQNDNILYGLDGSDIMFGDDSGVVLFGNNGFDFIFGGEGNDYISGGDENDLIVGGGGDDILYGDDGNDSISGTTGNDVLYGGDGDDLLSDGSGRDVMEGGSGADIFKITHVDADIDTITDFSVAEGDVLNLVDLLQDYDPLQSAISEYLTATEVNGNTVLSIDMDGAGGSQSFVDFLTLEGVSITTADLQALIDDGTIVL